LNLIHTVAFSGLVLFVGYGLRRLIRPLERYGRSQHVFLVVSMVGAFFIDFTNAVIITIFLNVLK
jgi:ESS family glutamate:Na+ symporter